MFRFYKIAIFVSFIIVLVSGCSNKEVVVKPNPVCISDYNSVLIEGRVGIKVQDNFTSGNFELKFVEDYFKLTINGPLNMGTKIIEVGPFGLKVDNISINLSFNNWMEGKHGWYFPIAEIKNIALEFGAGLVGITNYDNRWEYSRKFSDMSATSRPAEIPDTLNNVIVIAQPMDYELVRTVPSALSGSATGLGYSHDALTVLSLAQYIRNLGYEAIGSMNDTSLAIPYAIKAGLGEYGRHGLLITPKYGPRIRLGKVYTNLPLAHDRPIRFGVKEFCEICRRCTKGCPVKAIPDGPPSKDTHNQSNILGVKKWSVDGEKCFGFWAAQNTDCSICIRVCPYNKDYSRWLHKLGLRLAGTRLRHFMLWLDVKLGYGERQKSSLWWRQGTREKLLSKFAKIFF